MTKKRKPKVTHCPHGVLLNGPMCDVCSADPNGVYGDVKGMMRDYLNPPIAPGSFKVYLDEDDFLPSLPEGWK